MLGGQGERNVPLFFPSRLAGTLSPTMFHAGLFLQLYHQWLGLLQSDITSLSNAGAEALSFWGPELWVSMSSM